MPSDDDEDMYAQENEGGEMIRDEDLNNKQVKGLCWTDWLKEEVKKGEGEEGEFEQEEGDLH